MYQQRVPRGETGRLLDVIDQHQLRVPPEVHGAGDHGVPGEDHPVGRDPVHGSDVGGALDARHPHVALFPVGRVRVEWQVQVGVPIPRCVGRVCGCDPCVPVYAEALQYLGTEHARVISGDEGLDELSLAGGNAVAVVTPDGIRFQRVSAADAGLPVYPVEAIRGGDAQHNALELRKLLQGEHGAYRDAVLFNAAEALLVAGVVQSMPEGVEEAAEAIDKGLANALLNCWVAY